MDKFIVEPRFMLPQRVDTNIICDLMCNDVMDAEDKLARLFVFKECVFDLERVLDARQNLFTSRKG